MASIPQSRISASDPLAVMDNFPHALRDVVSAPKTRLTGVETENVPGTPVTIMDIKNLSELYTFRDYQIVTDFLLQNPVVVSTLIDAHPYVKLVWGNTASVKLDVSTDESEDNRLSAYIQTTEPVTQALQSLDKFDEIWWFQHSHGVISKLNFDVKCL